MKINSFNSQGNLKRYSIIANTYPTVYHFAFKYITFKLLGKINHFMSLNNEKLLYLKSAQSENDKFAKLCSYVYDRAS
ncbi:hypothetical protein T03_13380 [Trichinella britovi]|uniref:Uncharacterized protein n=1 Tax=Trichinella britovi TaxID=45882 RepID=A0A0V1D3I5_TRIBR|nr:hypothetical protein T03_13380 [Trichinella britovi]